MTGRRSLILAALGCALAVSGRAHAQDLAAARAAEARGRAAFETGSFEEAARHFTEAFAHAPAASTKFNEAFAWAKGGQPARAADAYELALSLGLPGALDGTARSRLAELERSLALVRVDAPAGSKVTLAHAHGIDAPARVHVTPGEHVVEVAYSDGTSFRHTITVAPGETSEVVAPPAAARARGEDRSKPPRGGVGAGDSSVRRNEGSSIVPVAIAFGGAAIAGGVAGVLGGMTLGAISDFEDSGNRDAALRDEAVTLRAATNVAAAVAVAAAATGLVLLWVRPSGARDTKPAAARWRSVTFAPAALELSLP